MSFNRGFTPSIVYYHRNKRHQSIYYDTVNLEAIAWSISSSASPVSFNWLPSASSRFFILSNDGCRHFHNNSCIVIKKIKIEIIIKIIQRDGEAFLTLIKYKWKVLLSKFFLCSSINIVTDLTTKVAIQQIARNQTPKINQPSLLIYSTKWDKIITKIKKVNDRVVNLLIKTLQLFKFSRINEGTRKTAFIIKIPMPKKIRPSYRGSMKIKLSIHNIISG